MKKKQKFQKFLNSVVKSHGEIEEDRKEIENDVKKMLELFENSSEEASDRSNFLSILNDIKKRYHALYGRHDGLIGKIKNKIHHRKGESRSGFSDSGSEDSSDEDESNHEQKIVKQPSLEDYQSFTEQIDNLSKRNADLEAQTTSMQTKLEESQHLAGELISRGSIIEKLEDELQTLKNSLKLLDAENEFLKTEMEKSKDQESKLSLQVSGLQEEIEVLMSEKEKVSNMLHQADNSIIELKVELEKMMEDTRKLTEDNSFLNEDLVKKDQEMVRLNEQLVLTGKEREALEAVVTEVESANDSLKSENERMLFENQNLKARVETAFQQISNQNDKLTMLEGENDALKSQVLKLSTHMREADETIKDMTIESGLLKEDISKLRDTITDQNHQLKVKDDENYAMALESSEFRKLVEQAEERSMVLSVEAERLKSENSILVNELENLKLDLEGNNQELSKHKQSLEATESKMNSLREENTLLSSWHENLKLELERHNEELSKIKQAMEATDSERNSLIEEKTALLRKISEGELVNDGLKAQIEDVQSEKSQLQLKINNLNLERRSANLQFSEVKNALVTAEEENKTLASENSVVKSKLLEAVFTTETLQTKLEELNQNSVLLSRMEEAEKDMIIETRLLKEDISKLHDTITDLNQQLKVKNDENYAMTLEFSESKTVLQQAEEKIMILSVEAKKLNSENSMLLARHENLKLELEGNNQDLSKHKQALEETESEMNFLREEKSLLLSGHENLKLELEGNNRELLKLKQALEATEFERNSLTEEKSALLNKINEGKLTIDGLKAQIEEVESEKFQLQLKISDLDLEIQSANLRLTDVTNALAAAEEEKKAIVSEKLIIESKLQEAEFMKERLQIEVGELNQKNSILLSKIEEAQKDMLIESRLLKEEISKLHDTITDLNHQLKVKDDENYAMALESSDSRKVIKQAEERLTILSVEAEKMKSENSMLLTERKSLRQVLEDNNQELSKHKQALEAIEFKLNSLKEENSFLLSGHENLKLELEGNNQALSKLEEALEATEFERNSLIEEKASLWTKIKEGGIAIDGLKAQIEEVESEKFQLQLKIGDLDLEIQSSNLRLTDVTNALAAAEEEKKTIVSEKLIIESKLQEAEFMKERLQIEVGELNQKNSILLSKIEEAQKDMLIESRLLKDKISKLHDTITDLNHQLKVKDDENYAMALESSDSRKVIKQAEERLTILSVEAERMKSENSMLLTERENLRQVLEDNNQELSKHKQALEAIEFKLNSLKEENSLLLSGHENLKLELEGNNQALSKLKEALEATEFERNSLIEEKASLWTKIKEGGIAIDGLKAQIEEVESEKFQLQQKISNLDLEIISANLQFTDVKNALVAAEEEKMRLISENSVVESMVHEAKFAKERILTELGESNLKNSILLSKIEEAEKSTNDFKFERDGLIADNTQLEIKVKKLITELEEANIQLNHLEKLKFSAEDKMTKLVSEISVLTDKLRLAEADNEKLERERDMLIEENTAFHQNLEGLQHKMVDHYKNLEVTLSEMQDMKDKLELVQKEVMHEVQTSTDTFKGDLLQMVTEKSDLDQQLKRLADISSTNVVSLKKMEDILRSKISDQETLLTSYDELLTKHKQLEDSYYDSRAKLETAEKKFEQIEMKDEIIQRMEKICAEQKYDISKWSENCRELSEKLSSIEVGKVDAEKEIQRLEVQLRLSNQKLKITETECKEKEENYKRLVAELQEELRLLDRYVFLWSRKSTELNNELKQIKVILETGMGTLVNELHEVESISLENMGHVEKQIAECLVELQNLKTSLKSELHEKKKLKNENHELAVGLSYKEGIILKLKDEASRNLAHLDEKEKELRILESRIAESEKNLKEKERLVLDKDEEKREAIRQLCLVIEYHWENRNYLVRYLSSVLRNRGTS